MRGGRTKKGRAQGRDQDKRKEREKIIEGTERKGRVREGKKRKSLIIYYILKNRNFKE